MKCENCGANLTSTKFCTECGAAVPKPVGNAESLESNENVKTDAPEVVENNENVDNKREEALLNLEKYETGTIVHPDEKPKKKRSIFCPQNPSLSAFLLLLGFAALLGIVVAIFFNIEMNRPEMTIVCRVIFSVMTAFILVLAFGYYLPAALTLNKMLKGKGVALEYRLKEYELVDLAEAAKSCNRGFYLAMGLFGLAFTVYYSYLLVTSEAATPFLWLCFAFSLFVFLLFGAMFFIMPKINYRRIMEVGERVIIGEKSVFYGGSYLHWQRIQPKLTFGNLNTKKHQLTLNFVQEFKNGSTRRRKVEMYAPDREIKAITKLLSLYEISAKEYQLAQQKNSILNEPDDKEKTHE